MNFITGQYDGINFTVLDKQLKYQEDLQSSFVRSTIYDKYRSRVISSLYGYGKDLKMCHTSINNAIKIFDHFTTAVLIETKQIYKAGVACLFLAAKVGERESDIPNISNVCEPESDLFKSIDEFCEWEKIVIDGVQWNLNFVTASSFLDLYNMTELIFPDDSLEGINIKENHHRILRYIYKYLQFFLELIAADPYFDHYKPSQIAAGIIALSRGVLNIKPIWRKELTTMTGYDIQQHFDIYENILYLYQVSYPEHSARIEKNGPRTSPDNIMDA